MSRVKGRDTGIERLIRSSLHKRGFRFRKHVRNLPGKPDIVFPPKKVVVFVDGDFWHGYRFPLWKEKLSAFWQNKIDTTRKRDQRNFMKLKRSGWRVIRVWQHEIEKDINACLKKITNALKDQN
jgi:DNA mismatch endonuclease (patch repair protein)